VQSSSQSDTTSKPTPNFLQARCPSCCRTEWKLQTNLKMKISRLNNTNDYLDEVGQVLQHTYAYFVQVVEKHIKHR